MNIENSPRLSASTLQIIRAALDADPAASPAIRRQILDACSSTPGAAAEAPTGRLYTPTEASGVLGATLPGVLKWIHAGKLKAQPSGKRSFLISEADLDAFVAERTPRPISAAALPDRLQHLAQKVKTAPTIAPGPRSRPRPSKDSAAGEKA